MDKKVYRATIWTKMTRHGDPLNPIERFFTSDLPYDDVVAALKRSYEGMQLALTVVKSAEELLPFSFPRKESEDAGEAVAFARDVRISLRDSPFAFDYEKVRQLHIDFLNAQEALARNVRDFMLVKEWVRERRGPEFLSPPRIDYNLGVAVFDVVPLKYDVVLGSLTIC